MTGEEKRKLAIKAIEQRAEILRSLEARCKAKDLEKVKKSQGVKLDLEPRIISKVKGGQIDASSSLGDYVDLGSSYKKSGGSRLQPSKVLMRKKGSDDHSESKESKWGDDNAVRLPLKLVVYILVGLVGVLILSYNLRYKAGQKLDENKPPKLALEQPVEVQKLEKKNPKEWFEKIFAQDEKRMLAILNTFYDDETSSSRINLVSDPDFYLANELLFKEAIRPRLGSNDPQQWSIEQVEDIAFLKLRCRDQLHMPYSAYLVKDGESLKLDIAATIAWSEISMKNQYSELAKGESKLLRCLVRRKEEFYNGPYNDEEHASYLLISPDKLSTIWGYVKRGSDMDLKLKDILNHGDLIVALKSHMRVTLRIARNHTGASPSQVDIVEVLHKEWVTPPSYHD